MPIDRIPVIHKFGILSHNHQINLQERIRESTRPQEQDRRSNSTEFIKDENGLEVLLKKLDFEEDDLSISKLNEEINIVLQRLKFKISSFDWKNGQTCSRNCWRDLFIISACKSSKFRKDALLLMKDSLLSAPLTKLFIPTLLELGLGCLQLIYLDEQINSLNNALLVKVSWLIFIRLYYHHLAGDIDIKSSSNEIESMFLMSEGISKILANIQINPINWLYTENILNVIEWIHEDISKDNRLTDGLSSVKGGALIKDDDMVKTNNYFENHVPETLLNKKLLLLQHSLNLWKDVSRKLNMGQSIMNEISKMNPLTDIPNTRGKWLQSIVALLTMAECAKISMQCTITILKFGEKMLFEMRRNINGRVTVGCGKDRIQEEVRLEESHYVLQFTLLYLTSLADIIQHGVSTNIQMVALFGNDLCKGLVQYNGEDLDFVWQIQFTYYQCIYETYHYLSHGHSLRNTIWCQLLKFEQKKHDPRVLRIMKLSQEDRKCFDVSLGILYSKISTNLSIMLSAEYSSHKEKELKEDSVKEPFLKRAFEVPLEKSTDNKTKGNKNSSNESFYIPESSKPDTPEPKGTSYELESWKELKSVVSSIYQREVKEDEIKLDILRRKMEEDLAKENKN